MESTALRPFALTGSGAVSGARVIRVLASVR